MGRVITLWACVFVVVEGLIALGAWWMIHQVDTGAFSTSTPGEAKDRIVQACTLFGATVGLIILLLATVTALGRRSRRDDS